MNNSASLAFSILESMEIAVLKRIAPRRYELFGTVPKFYRDFFASADGTPSNEPWLNSPMLEFFLDDAEEFFNKKAPGSYSSGVWQEDGKTDAASALIAEATVIDGAELIIVRILYEDYQQRTGLLRKARQQLLDNRNLLSSLELLKTKSRTDGLTQVFNHATFMEVLSEKVDVLEKRLATGKRMGAPFSLIMLDIDNFKSVNDTYGHLCGDMVLQTLGKVLNDTLRRNDVVARYGGEEFIILINGGTLEQALKIGEKIRKTIEASDFYCVPAITASLGCACYAAGERVQDIIARADAALYDAKKGGKNRVCSR